MGAETDLRAWVAQITETYGAQTSNGLCAAEVLAILDKHATLTSRKGKKTSVTITMTRAQWERIYEKIARSSDPIPTAQLLAVKIRDTLWPMPECAYCMDVPPAEPF